MSRDILKDRESAFEYEFCHEVDKELLQRLREQLEADKRRKALAQATGIGEESVLQELDELDIGSECVLALSLYPLVHVAWSDGSVEEHERAAVLEAAEAIGHRRDTPSFRLLEAWLESEPTEKMFTAWKDYVSQLLRTISPVAGRVLKHTILTRSRRVAEAAGGFLGLHKTSTEEEAALVELDSIFADARPVERSTE